MSVTELDRDRDFERRHTPPSDRNRHIYLGYEWTEEPAPPGTKAYCGHTRRSSTTETYDAYNDPRTCVVCLSLFEGAHK